MDDTPHRENPADWEPPMPTEAELLAALEESEADLAAGRIVPGELVRQRLLDSIARLEAKHAATLKRKPAERR
jgi:hypothetical protein